MQAKKNKKTCHLQYSHLKSCLMLKKFHDIGAVYKNSYERDHANNVTNREGEGVKKRSQNLKFDDISRRAIEAITIVKHIILGVLAFERHTGGISAAYR